MFFHACYELLDQTLSTQAYKQEVAKLTPLGMRRANRFNLLAVYGALCCNARFGVSKNTHVFVATEYGPVGSLMRVLGQMQKGYLAPFDFLGLNTNASFYVAKALGVQGRHAMVTSHDISLEKALHLAYVDMRAGEAEAVLVGLVDETLAEVPAFERCITNVAEGCVDKSMWFYASTQPQGAKAEVVMVRETDRQGLLEADCFGYTQVNVTSFAAQDATLMAGLKQANKTVTTVSLARVLEQNSCLHVSQDSLGKMVVMGIKLYP
ncbi:MAG: hypothetical protein IBX45_02610 [Campylobacterales bacterium]|nr:hypothetical protein [Campylobacterales bacterium]